MKFFSDTRAAEYFATLEYERLESRFGEIISRDEAVVSSADDDDVAFFHGSRQRLCRSTGR